MASWMTVPMTTSLNSKSESETELTNMDGFIFISFLFLLFVLPRFNTILSLFSSCFE